MINIRNANISDTELIFNFINQLAIYEKLSHKVRTNPDELKSYLFGEHKYANVLIAEYDNIHVGFALYFYNFSTFLGKPGLFLEDLFVIENYRNLGIGKAMMKHLAAICVDNSFGRFEWNCLDWNPARKFYEMIGATPQDEWITYRLDGQNLIDFAKKI